MVYDGVRVTTPLEYACARLYNIMNVVAWMKFIATNWIFVKRFVVYVTQYMPGRAREKQKLTFSLV